MFSSAIWRKSSYSGTHEEDTCVEVAFVADSIGVRDSKNRGGRALVFSDPAWKSLQHNMIH
ncbi:uncharacterized protein DUF397 [Herbihabitans rhizosphaerae]|uniref:Uncharacterized protein DUF397 n=1 Tax=Herbihabitans rhizosphaerae TaxID=1872711 RepID=A0A4V2EU40_9PSEU|nr:DUF397 domain-containing protein [Herbihabitans rhizosphaerae]RZS43243.1 uncharacterized protein DUF397 [Herbihabitans rhizosphaerae]